MSVVENFNANVLELVTNEEFTLPTRIMNVRMLDSENYVDLATVAHSYIDSGVDAVRYTACAYLTAEAIASTDATNGVY